MTRIRYMIFSGLLLIIVMAGLPASVLAQPISTLPNTSFEMQRGSDNHMYPMPQQWWLNPRDGATQPTDNHFGLASDTHFTGVRSIFVDAGKTGMIGWLSDRFDLPAVLPGLHLTVRVKRSDDYQGNEPVLLIFWFAGKRLLGQSMGERLDPPSPWETWGIREAADTIPEGADSAKVYVGSTALLSKTSRPPTGRLWFDDVCLEVMPLPDRAMNFRMNCQKKYSWFEMGQPIIFETSQPILVGDKVQTLQATIYDSHDRIVDHVSVDRTTFLSKGLTWFPPQPGFYQFEFSYRYEGQAELTPLSFTFKSSLRNGEWITTKGSRHNVVVTANAPRPLSQRLPQFGFHVSKNYDDLDLFLIDALEISFIRYQSVLWYVLEPEQGKHDWSSMDRAMSDFNARGLPVIGTFWGTPQWASSHPEKTGIDLFIPGYVAYAPKVMSYFADFVKQVLNRYGKDINTWEIWNEPHLPYGSIFWRDTTEKYVELLKTGYQTIKQEQPGAEVWIGGMGGQRYLPFYKVFLQSGGGGYYDRLALHGSWPTPTGYRVLEKKYNAPSVPWVDSEWHAILISASDPSVPSEADLGRRMLTDLCNQFKHGVEKVALFGSREWNEKEIIPYAKKAGTFAQSSGMFRMHPYRQPRLPALLLRTFLDHFSGMIRYRGEYVLDGDQQAILMDSQSGPVMLLWNIGKQAQPLDHRLLPALASEARLLDWEDHPIDAKYPTIQPDCMYYLTGLSSSLIASLPTGGKVLPVPPTNRNQVPVTVQDVFTPGRLFTTPDAISDSQHVHWIEKTLKYQSSDDKTKPAGYAARFAVAFDKTGMDLIVDVTDASFYPPSKANGKLYQYDSLEIALSTDDTILPGSQIEFQIGLSDQGPVIWKSRAPGFAGDLPANWSMTNHVIKYGWAWIDNKDGRTLYRIHIDLSELYPWAYTAGEPQYFSLLINNNDGQGRSGYLMWSGGIVNGKNPALFGKLTPSEVHSHQVTP